jgi:hypothetical protein
MKLKLQPVTKNTLPCFDALRGYDKVMPIFKVFVLIKSKTFTIKLHGNGISHHTQAVTNKYHSDTCAVKQYS